MFHSHYIEFKIPDFLLEEIILSLQSYFKAHRFVVKNKLWKWILIPGILYAILFFTGFYFFWTSAGAVLDWVLVKTGVRGWLQRENISWLNFIFLFGQLMLQLVLLMFYFSWLKHIVLIIGSPLFAYLSEKTESLMIGKELPFSGKRFFLDTGRGVGIAIRNILWQSVYTIAILILAMIPLFGWITPLMALFVECFYFGFSMVDYTNERKEMPVSLSVDFINSHKGYAIGNGMGFYAMHILPVVGWVLAPGYAIIAATLSLQEKHQKIIAD